MYRVRKYCLCYACLWPIGRRPPKLGSFGLNSYKEHCDAFADVMCTSMLLYEKKHEIEGGKGTLKPR